MNSRQQDYASDCLRYVIRFGVCILLSFVSERILSNTEWSSSNSNNNIKSQELSDSYRTTDNNVEMSSTPVASRCAHDVSAYVRRLSNGRQPSRQKIDTAKENGFVLEEGTTWVKSYRTGKNMEEL